MSPVERDRWLIGHTYEETPDGWVLRTDRAAPTASDRTEPTGTWTRDDWYCSFDDGFVMRGHQVAGTEIFARPELPEDPG